LPSYNEGLPIAILEAMAYGHPIISTPVGGIPEVVKNGVNGTLVTPGNTNAIAAAIKKYIESPQYIINEGNNAYETVKDFFPERVFADLLDIYQRVNA
jgi:glycosyltransferase involved in cell wall biosynthesis